MELLASNDLLLSVGPRSGGFRRRTQPIWVVLRTLLSYSGANLEFGTTLRNVTSRKRGFAGVKVSYGPSHHEGCVPQGPPCSPWGREITSSPWPLSRRDPRYIYLRVFSEDAPRPRLPMDVLPRLTECTSERTRKSLLWSPRLQVESSHIGRTCYL